jgi:hypothetical protein
MSLCFFNIIKNIYNKRICLSFNKTSKISKEGKMEIIKDFLIKIYSKIKVKGKTPNSHHPATSPQQIPNSIRKNRILVKKRGNMECQKVSQIVGSSPKIK